jgi:peptide/nickel transport system permease protein
MRPLNSIDRLVGGRRIEPGSAVWFFRRDRVGMICLSFLLLVLFVAIFAPYLTPYADEGRGATNVPNKFLPPGSNGHLLGADSLGRDLLARIFFGARIALLVAFTVNSVAVVVGVLLGATAGYFGGWLDDLIMRITDVFLAFPPLLLAILIAAALGPSLPNTIIAITLVWWPWYARLVRGQAASVRERSYVRAARSIGVPDLTIVVRHVVPNVLTPVFVQVAMDMGSSILVASGLSFIGLGPQPPMADWGLMISEGRRYILAGHWWVSTFPGLALFLTALSFNLLGDSVRDALDPRVRGAG